jgi:flagellar biosynthesis GTPase FlhF
MVRLPFHFIPGPLDVICARGKAAKTHEGNQRYQDTIEHYIERYVKVHCKLQKMAIISEIVTLVRLKSPLGGFVKLKTDGRWYEVGDHFAREKVSQSLRDSLHALYRSSCRSKTVRRAMKRKQELVVANDDEEDPTNKNDETKKQEPKEGPTAEEPTAKEPTAEEPTAEGPTAEGPTAEQLTQDFVKPNRALSSSGPRPIDCKSQSATRTLGERAETILSNKEILSQA